MQNERISWDSNIHSVDDVVHCCWTTHLIQQKCLNKWIESAVLGTRIYNFRPLIVRASTQTLHPQHFTRELCELLVLIVLGYDYNMMLSLLNRPIYPVIPHLASLYHSTTFNSVGYTKAVRSAISATARLLAFVCFCVKTEDCRVTDLSAQMAKNRWCRLRNTSNKMSTNFSDSPVWSYNHLGLGRRAIHFAHACIAV